MGLFDTARHGAVHEVVPGREWRWEIGNYTQHGADARLNSAVMTDSFGVSFYLHIVVSDGAIEGSKNAQPGPKLGFFVHYMGDKVGGDRIVGCPKFTYALGNARGRVCHQQTAHSVPRDTLRCGFPDPITHEAVRACVSQSGYDVLVVWFRFGEDTVRSTGELGEFMWKIPRFPSVRIGPFCSNAFARINKDDQCCLELRVDKKNRAQVVCAVKARMKKVVPTTFRMTTGSGKEIVPMTKLGNSDYARFDYAAITDGLRRHKEETLIIFMEIHKAPGLDVSSPLDERVVPRFMDDPDGKYCIMDGEEMSGRGDDSPRDSPGGSLAGDLEEPTR
eukprot:TRINITY_DN5829_c0_g2_i2.p1 TRINITY_DN5829_c0_g2~~TRINITY_DN5829_c0_g2_i2.p1  ORF type:complete len:333 (+),score=117.88 TRINITY_DN5829_c0_g2_i2:78-1076(+)